MVHGRKIVTATLAVLVLGLGLGLSGCGKKEPDPFIEEWTKKAKETEHNTYTPQPNKVDFSQVEVKTAPKPEDSKPKRDLPSMRVSLNFYNTDLQAVLRSLARIANQNIILSAALQAPENQGKYKVNLNVSETPWNQAFESILNANGLSYDWDGEIIRVMTLADLKASNDMKKAVAEKMLENQRIKTVEPVVTVKVQINYADVVELEKTIQGYLYPKKSAGPGGGAPGGAASPAGGGDSTDDLASRVKGFVVADTHSNSLIIQATKEHAELLVKLIEKLDEPRDQVHLKAFIVEATRDSLFDIGFQWGGFYKTQPTADGNSGIILPGANRVVDSDGTVYYQPVYGSGPAGRGYAFNYPAGINTNQYLQETTIGNVPTGLGAQGAAINFMWGMLSGNNLQLQLTALARDGKINIVSEPSITTLDNKMAFTENGEKVPYVTVSQNGTNVQFVDAVLRLEMTPHVIDDKNLRLRVLIKNDEVVTDQTQWVQGNPPIRKKQTDTTLIVENGATLIISGLAKHNKTDSSQGLPGFKDIPGAGYLFGDKAKQDTRADILVFITPTVLKSRPQAQAGQAQPRASAPANPGSKDDGKAAPAAGATTPAGPTGQTPAPASSAPAGQTPAPAKPASPDRRPTPLGQAPEAPGIKPSRAYAGLTGQSAQAFLPDKAVQAVPVSPGLLSRTNWQAPVPDQSATGRAEG